MIQITILLFLAVGSSIADEFSDGSREFSGSLYNELIVDNSDNILVSPFALEAIVAMAQSGAVGTTGEEIRNSLHLPNTKEDTEAALKKIISSMENIAPAFDLVNKISVDSSYSINSDFETVASDVYQATTSSGSSGISLTNLLNFQATWANAFQLKSTKQAFYQTIDKTVDSEVMYLKAATYNYAESEELDAQILELPFVGGSVSATIVLPNEKEGIAILEKIIDAVLTAPKYTKETVEVTLPTFRIATNTGFSSILKNLGIEKAFDADEADFSGIAGEPGDLYLGEVTQKTYLAFGPTGLNADTTTGESALIAPQATKTFTADRPFIFYVKVNDVIVLVGRVLDPAV